MKKPQFNQSRFSSGHNLLVIVVCRLHLKWLWKLCWSKNDLPFLWTHTYTLGGFNVSNLMGITRRKIDIGKKITFYFLQNVWKCTVFFAFAFKVCKKCYYDPKFFFLENYHYGYQKNAEFNADFKFVDDDLNKCP